MGFVDGIDHRTREQLAKIDQRAVALPPDQRRALYEAELARSAAVHRAGVWGVVGPIGASLTLFFVGIIAAAHVVPPSLRGPVAFALIGQMVVCLFYVYGRGSRVALAKNLENAMKRRLRDAPPGSDASARK